MVYCNSHAHQHGAVEGWCGQQQCRSFSCDGKVYGEDVSQKSSQPIPVIANDAVCSMGGACHRRYVRPDLCVERGVYVIPCDD